MPNASTFLTFSPPADYFLSPLQFHEKILELQNYYLNPGEGTKRKSKSFTYCCVLEFGKLGDHPHLHAYIVCSQRPDNLRVKMIDVFRLPPDPNKCILKCEPPRSKKHCYFYMCSDLHRLESPSSILCDTEDFTKYRTEFYESSQTMIRTISRIQLLEILMQRAEANELPEYHRTHFNRDIRDLILEDYDIMYHRRHFKDFFEQIKIRVMTTNCELPNYLDM